MMQRNQTNSRYKNLTSPTRPPPFDRNSAGRDRFNTRTRAYQYRSPGDVVGTGGRWETNQTASRRIESRRKVGSGRVESKQAETEQVETEQVETEQVESAEWWVTSCAGNCAAA